MLLTGGATGIGYALAEKFLARGNTVITCGRREDRLNEAAEKLPGLITIRCDLAISEERKRLFAEVTQRYPELNVVVNNAGIQRDVDLTSGDDNWDELSEEIRINLDAPIHLSQLFASHLSKQKHAAIIQVSSGLGFTPAARAPIYCATKSGLHTFSQLLRHQLRGSGVEVIEFIPPAVDSELNLESRVRRGYTQTGVTAAEFADGMLAGLAEGKQEIGYGTTAHAGRLAPEQRDAIFARMNP